MRNWLEMGVWGNVMLLQFWTCDTQMESTLKCSWQKKLCFGALEMPWQLQLQSQSQRRRTWHEILFGKTAHFWTWDSFWNQGCAEISAPLWTHVTQAQLNGLDVMSESENHSKELATIRADDTTWWPPSLFGDAATCKSLILFTEERREAQLVQNRNNDQGESEFKTLALLAQNQRLCCFLKNGSK